MQRLVWLLDNTEIYETLENLSHQIITRHRQSDPKERFTELDIQDYFFAKGYTSLKKA
jgi:hypothetical protein